MGKTSAADAAPAASAVPAVIEVPEAKWAAPIAAIRVLIGRIDNLTHLSKVKDSL
jgi:hypothetical protein